MRWLNCQTTSSKRSKRRDCLILISIPLLVCAWGVFSDDPEIITKLDAFFDQVNKFPFWLQGLIIGGYSSVLGIKGVSAFKKK